MTCVISVVIAPGRATLAQTPAVRPRGSASHLSARARSRHQMARAQVSLRAGARLTLPSNQPSISKRRKPPRAGCLGVVHVKLTGMRGTAPGAAPSSALSRAALGYSHSMSQITSFPRKPSGIGEDGDTPADPAFSPRDRRPGHIARRRSCDHRRPPLVADSRGFLPVRAQRAGHRRCWLIHTPRSAHGKRQTTIFFSISTHPNGPGLLHGLSQFR